MSGIASVSLNRPLSEFADELGRSFSEYGFAIVCDHGLPAQLIARADARAREFFALPEEVKRRYSSRAAAARAVTLLSARRPLKTPLSTISRSSGTSGAAFPRIIH